VADRGAHPFHLMLAAFVQDELESGGPEAGDLRRRRGSVVELDTVSKPLQRLVRRLALDLGLVGLLHLVPRVGEPVGELAVVREQERACCVGVEPSDRDDACFVVDEPDDGRPPVRVMGGGDDGGGLRIGIAGIRSALRRHAGGGAREGVCGTGDRHLGIRPTRGPA